MPRFRDMEVLTTEAAFHQLKVDQLKPLVRLLGEEPPTHKADLVELLTHAMQQPKRVRQLYEGLDETSRVAIQEAVHDPEGRLHPPNTAVIPISASATRVTAARPSRLPWHCSFPIPTGMCFPLI